MSTSQLIVFLAYCFFIGVGVAATVLQVGKVRPVITPGAALAVMVVGLLQVVALAYLTK